MTRIRSVLLLVAPLVVLARVGGRTAREASAWFEAADDVWEPFLDDDLDRPDALG